MAHSMPLVELPSEPDADSTVERSDADAITARIGRREQFPHAAFSDESIAKACAFVPRRTDCFILTAPKTGTSWLQQICHQLRQGSEAGEMDFEDVYQVVPWAQMAGDLDQSLDAEQERNPRLFKSHQRLSSINRGGRYICTVREPASTMYSWFTFVKAMEIPAAASYATISEFVFCEEFVSHGMRFGASLWDYYAEFHACRLQPNVLVLVFEDLIKDLPGHLPLIASHLGLECTPEIMEAVVGSSVKSFMQKHTSKFDASWAYEKMKELNRLPPEKLDCNRPATRVTNRSTERIADLELNPEATAFLRRMWEERAAPATGCDNYGAMAAEVREELTARRAAL